MQNTVHGKRSYTREQSMIETRTPVLKTNYGISQDISGAVLK